MSYQNPPSPFDSEWQLPPKPLLHGGTVKETPVLVFGFDLDIDRQAELADKYGIKPGRPMHVRADAFLEYLAKVLPPPWRRIARIWVKDPVSGKKRMSACLMHNINTTKERMENYPDMESVKTVWEILDAKEGPKCHEFGWTSCCKLPACSSYAVRFWLSLLYSITGSWRIDPPWSQTTKHMISLWDPLEGTAVGISMKCTPFLRFERSLTTKTIFSVNCHVVVRKDLLLSNQEEYI
ncbi:hypothetical protein CPC08DRAFT_380722 [Agrocybe pediades]|nr:hypothetical protein CPC08DRAFT_380722 [Agrocybe pediades]